jgi:hypothetical protein
MDNRLFLSPADAGPVDFVLVARGFAALRPGPQFRRRLRRLKTEIFPTIFSQTIFADTAVWSLPASPFPPRKC